MTTMLCPAADQLRAFYLGQLPDEQSEELLSHVVACSACQSELETAFNSDDSLIVSLRQSDRDLDLFDEPACDKGVLRALGALAAASENRVCQDHRNEPIEPSLPKTIGEYEILRALGHGGMGRVFLAKHSKLDRMVALKILAGHRLGDRLASQRFESEMRVIGRLAHPNIVVAHDAREIDGTAVLVTEYIDGLDLGQLIQRVGRLEIADACEIIRQIAEALQYTSDQGLVHRDVKPSNIMISHAGEVKLLDLGLARLQFGNSDSADITGTGQTMGTADYISPEQVTDSRKVDARSDIYSLGATLYKLLSGRAPFVGEEYGTAFSKMTAHVSAIPANLRTQRADIPIELERLVTAMLSKRPDDRPQSPQEIAIKLTAFARDCELKGLVQRATSITLLPHLTTATESISKKAAKLRTQSFLSRPIPVYKAIAAGFIGMLLGLCLGIIITITHPDGSKTTLSIPDESKVEIAESSKASNNVNNLGHAPATPMTVPPLQFALMVNKESSGKAPFIRDNELSTLLEQLPRTRGDVVVRNDAARFVRMSEMAGGNVAITAWNNGVQYALVSTDPKYSIGWDEIEGRILESNSAPVDANREAVVSLKFDKTLGEKMSRLSTAGIGQHLAIMVDEIVVQSPRINSKIGTKVQICGIFDPSQVQNMRQYFSRSQSTTSNAIKSSIDETIMQFSDAASSHPSSPALDFVEIQLKVIEIDRVKLRELGIDFDTENRKLFDKSSNSDIPKLEELKKAASDQLVDSLVNAGAAKVLSQVSVATMNGKQNIILCDTGKSTIAIEMFPTLQGNSALVQFDLKQFDVTESSKASKQSNRIPPATKNRFFEAIVKLDTLYGLNTGMATSLAPAEQLDTNLIMVVRFEKQTVPMKKATSAATSTTAQTLALDLARMMKAIRSATAPVVDMGTAASEFALACGMPEKQPLIKSAFQKCKFKGIISFDQGLAKKETWLSEKPEEAYSIKVSPKELLEDVKAFLNVLAGPTFVDDVLNGLESDPKGPQVDMKQILRDRLSEIVVDAESSIIAFKLSDASSLQTSVQRWASLDEVGPMLIGNYLVFGSKERLQEVVKRHTLAQ